MTPEFNAFAEKSRARHDPMGYFRVCIQQADGVIGAIRDGIEKVIDYLSSNKQE